MDSKRRVCQRKVQQTKGVSTKSTANEGCVNKMYSKRRVCQQNVQQTKGDLSTKSTANESSCCQTTQYYKMSYPNISP